MKILKKAVALALAAIMCTATASANGIKLYGIADPNALALTVLVTEKGASTSNLDANQILYINQYAISDNGSFTLTLPVLNTEYDVYSNALSFGETKPEAITLYIDPTNGSDSNKGTSADKAYKSFSKAYNYAGYDKKVILLGDASYSDATAVYADNITIEGKTGAETLTLPTSVSLKGNLTISKVNLNVTAASTLYANGHKFKIDSNVTATRPSTNTTRLTVYGGTNGTAYTGDTDITLLAGYYTNVFGGCNNAALTGSTNVVLGGNANSGDGIDDDDSSTISPSYVYGGGNNGAVSGETNVTLQDNAVSKYVVGAGCNTGGTVPVANVYIKGGKVMNVYGSRTAASNGCTHNITMTGGLAEAIFGGCESASMTGNTYVNLLGGDVSRRVYTGCYNNYKIISWDSDNYVKGSTYLTIAPGMKLCTKNGLSTSNQTNIGVFAGSRTESEHSDEINTIIYLDGCYNDYKGYITNNYPFNSYETYTLAASAGGSVTGTTTPGKVHIVPVGDKYGIFNSTPYRETDITLLSGHNTVEFKDDFKIHSAVASVVDTNVNAVVNLSANNLFGEKNPTAYVAVYDDVGNLVSCRLAKTDPATGEYSFDMGNTFVNGNTYTLNVMIWDEDQKPLINVYEIIVK